MKHLNLKLIAYLLLLSSFLSIGNTIYAQTLLFKAGDRASYSIEQKMTAEFIMDAIHCESEAKIDFDITILNVDQETQNFPFDVEIIVRKVSLSETHQDGFSTEIIKYDSEDNIRTLRNNFLAKQLGKLLNHPLIFRIEGDFQVEETTGYLALIDENLDSLSAVGILVTPWSFELLLTQLFHFAGKELQVAQAYPVSCYQFLNWEDEALDEREYNIYQSSNYVVRNIDSKKIKASWEGNDKVENRGDVTVKGNVTWNASNPIIQERFLEFSLEEEIKDWFFPWHVKMSGQQIWKSKIH